MSKQWLQQIGLRTHKYCTLLQSCCIKQISHKYFSLVVKLILHYIKSYLPDKINTRVKFLNLKNTKSLQFTLTRYLQTLNEFFQQNYTLLILYVNNINHDGMKVLTASR